MNIIYGIEPDLCIKNPHLISEFKKDLILPKYFYTQLQYLKDSNLIAAKTSATEIINSCSYSDNLESLIFHNQKGGFIYFINEKIAENNSQDDIYNFSGSNLLLEYLLSLQKIGSILSAKVYFCSESKLLLNNISNFGFTSQTVEEFKDGIESWLKPEMILALKEELIPPVINSKPQIVWKEDRANNSFQEEFIWIEQN